MNIVFAIQIKQNYIVIRLYKENFREKLREAYWRGI